MGKRRAATRTSILTPALPDHEFSRAGKLAFWKRVLPEGEGIDYTHKDGTKARVEFTEESNLELAEAFRSGAMDQTPFMLADVDNRHTMDPEKYRGEVTDLRRHTELPPEVAQTVADDQGSVAPGLWARIEFASKRAAKAVVANPKLGVSARIRSAGDGKPSRIIHVLGTLDPKVQGLGAWRPALDFSEYAHDELIDLSEMTYSEAPVSKKNKGGTRELDLSAVPDIDTIDVADIDKMTDTEVAAFLAVYGPGSEDASLSTEDDDDIQLSESAMRQIDLANARNAETERNAREALKRAAGIEWRASRESLLRKGVPPHVLDLAEPVLSRPYDLVVDLSNTDDGELDVASIVRKLVDGYEGTIDLSDVELGHAHGEDETGDAKLEALRARFATEFSD